MPSPAVSHNIYNLFNHHDPLQRALIAAAGATAATADSAANNKLLLPAVEAASAAAYPCHCCCCMLRASSVQPIRMTHCCEGAPCYEHVGSSYDGTIIPSGPKQPQQQYLNSPNRSLPCCRMIIIRHFMIRSLAGAGGLSCCAPMHPTTSSSSSLTRLGKILEGNSSSDTMQDRGQLL
jgi:hypothetical protein